ncbi:MAG: hypothetical protein Q8P05_01750 [Candidatus Diapherotrites archaeon]|nr:hypothetical protein [Candidatus Diapherotrites archaeon]MDZ4256347.1 hypothetical protein [archaeon]
MIDLILATDILAVPLFLGAFIYAWKSVPHMEEKIAYWVIFAFGMLTMFGWNLALVLETLGYAAPIVAAWKIPIIANAITNLIICSILAFIDYARPFD